MLIVLLNLNLNRELTMTRKSRSSHVMKLAWKYFRSGEATSHSEALKLAHSKISGISESIKVQAVIAKSQNLVKQVRVKHDLGCGCGNCPGRDWKVINLSSLPTGKIKHSSIYSERARQNNLVKPLQGGCGFLKKEFSKMNGLSTKREAYVPKEMRHSLYPDMANWRMAPVYKGHTAH